jgi:hypothetical protein
LTDIDEGQTYCLLQYQRSAIGDVVERHLVMSIYADRVKSNVNALVDLCIVLLSLKQSSAKQGSKANNAG